MTTILAASSSRSDTKRKHVGSICLGVEDFDDIIEKNAAFIDKTMFIKEWMEESAKVGVFLRPRRFGKSTNLSMLKSFFSFGAELKDFSRFLIGSDTEFSEKHCGKYPVVFLNMKGIVGDNWGEMLSRVWSCLRETLEDQEENLNEQDVKFIGIDCYDSTAQPNESIAAGFLKHLISRLRKKFKKRVILLIDEYDAPLNHAFRMGFFEKASRFFGEFYSNGLKGNQALDRACLMGIFEIKGNGMLSGLNNLTLYSCKTERFSQYFGFTEGEISAFLDGDEKGIQDVMEWYNGYYMGSHHVINPWSFMNYADTGELASYWVQTANIDSISSIINPVLNVNLIKILAELYEGNMYEIGKLSTRANYGCSFNLNLILSFFVHTGYLTYNEKKVSMPNQEIKCEWANCSFGVTDSGMIDSSFQQSITNALQAELFETMSLCSLMSQILLNCSCFDIRSENSYHMLFFGIFTTICGQKTSSSREGGHGQYDIAIAFENINRLFIFEFMHSRAMGDLEEDAKLALKQIHKKKYYTIEQYRQWKCIAIGVSFFLREMSQLECEEFEVSF